MNPRCSWKTREHLGGFVLVDSSKIAKVAVPAVCSSQVANSGSGSESPTLPRLR